MSRILNLTVTSPVQTFSEPLSYPEACKFLELPILDQPDSEQMSLIEEMISTARHQAEIQEDKDLVRKQWDLYLDSFDECGPLNCWSWLNSGEIPPRGPLVSVDLVSYRNSDGNYTSLAEGADYIVDLRKALVLPSYGKSWPSFTAWPSGSVLIRFTSGFDATDAYWNDAGKSIKLGMRFLISAWYNNRLPFESGNSQGINEYPWTVSALLRSVPRVG